MACDVRISISETLVLPRYTWEQIEGLIRYREYLKKEGNEIDDYLVYNVTENSFQVLSTDGVVRPF
jgi:hypothetical protein